jgi:hypothetical protein
MLPRNPWTLPLTTSTRSGFAALCALALAAFLAAPAPALAGLTDLPTDVQIPDDSLGEFYVTGFRLVEDLPEEYIQEEFLVFGNATIYNYAHNPPDGPTDIVPVQEDVPYGTRIVVNRPAEKNKFNGTVVIEWWNSTAGFDTAPVWDVSAEYFAREGYIYVGVTNGDDAFDFLLGGCSLLGLSPPTCGTRYADVELADNGIAYEMVSQIATLLKSDSPLNPIPSGYEVERLYHAGQSQQGGSMVTYASGFHVPGVNDGYFVQANVFPRNINDGPECGADGSPPFPDCRPELQGDDRWVRTDLPVPVVQALGETDVSALFGITGRQADTENFRYYEMAGVAHLTVHEGVDIIPPLTLEDLCENPVNSSADGPVVGSYLYNAMWDNLEQQVKNGVAPPPTRLMDVDDSGEVQRDEFMNALGGVRVPEMDVPTGSHYPPTNQANPNLPGFLQFLGNLACFLGGSTTPFDNEELKELYRNHGGYVNRVVHAANDLRRDRFLLQEDRKIIVDAAAKSTIACGIGFEIALLLPPVMWWRARRRRR